MKIELEPYLKAKEQLPAHGQYIIGHQTAKEIVVYQAFRPSIAEFALAHQFFGGSEYGYRMMSWIEDVTEFVKEQKTFVDQQRLDLLQVPVERVWEIENFEIKRRVGV